MAPRVPYAPVGGDYDGQNSEAFGFHDEMPSASEEIREQSRRFGATSSAYELVTNVQDTPAKVETPREFRALTFLDNVSDSTMRPEWQDPVRWCLWGSIAVLVINVVFTIAAVGVSASKHSGLGFASITLYQGSCSATQDTKIGLHLLINVLSMTMTATSSYCCTILMAPSRTDVDRAHSKGTWLSVGVFSWRNFRNLRTSSQVLWSLLLFTSIIMQMVYNSVVYSSLNANSYPAFIAPLDFVSNSSVPTSFFEEQSCWPEDVIIWNITDLRAGIFNGSFEYLSKDECIEAYANSYISDRRSVVIVTDEPMTGEGISLAGYGYPGAIAGANPTNKLDNSEENLLKHQLSYAGLTPVGFEWMCSKNAPESPNTCSSAFLLGLGPWNVSSLPWPLQTSVYLPNSRQKPISKYSIGWTSESTFETELLASNITWTRKDVDAFLSYVLTNPLPEQMRAYLNKTSWIASAGPGVNVSASCPTADELMVDYDYHMIGLPPISVEHCLSQKTPEECYLFYQLPIALTIIICNLIKVICIWLLLRIDRRDLFLTVGDAISSFLQRPDPTTKQWSTLSPEVIAREKSCPWNPGNKSLGREPLLSEGPHPGLLPTTRKQWSKASSLKVWGLTCLVLVLYILMSTLLPFKAVQSINSIKNDWQSIWQIKGWGVIQSTALLSNFAKSFVGMILLANTPQLTVSLLYFCFNDTLTRFTMAADYNDFSIHRRPLRVSFPRGEQRSTFYLTTPYRYSVPLLTICTLVHWFVSEGIFYVQILPYNIHGESIPSEGLVTCGVSTIPLELGLFLMVGVFVIIVLLGTRNFKASKMPIVFGWSVAISAACHPPRLDLDAAFKPVQWGVVEDDPDAPYPHCSFTSKEVKQPEISVQYA